MEHEDLPFTEDDMTDLGTFFSFARAQKAAKAEQDSGVGDLVHFWDFQAARCRAAIVTQDDLDTVWLNYLMPGEISWRCVSEVPHDENKDSPSWHWPCGGH